MSEYAFSPGEGWLDYVPTFTGFSSVTWAPTPGGDHCRYVLIGGVCVFRFRGIPIGTSNATSFTISAPFTALYSSATWSYGENNGNPNYSGAAATIGSGTSTISMILSNSSTGWTASGAKGAWFTLIYEI